MATIPTARFLKPRWPRQRLRPRVFAVVALPLVVLALAHDARADFELTAPDGRRLLLKDDGTWKYQDAKEKDAVVVKSQPPEEATLQLEQKVERGPHCRVVLRLVNTLPNEIGHIVPSFSAYRANGTMHETVTVGFQSVRPAESLQRAVEFTRIACADIARVQVSDADRCQMGDLNKFSPANGQCLARLRIAPSTVAKFDK